MYIIWPVMTSCQFHLSLCVDSTVERPVGECWAFMDLRATTAKGHSSSHRWVQEYGSQHAVGVTVVGFPVVGTWILLMWCSNHLKPVLVASHPSELRERSTKTPKTNGEEALWSTEMLGWTQCLRSWSMWINHRSAEAIPDCHAH